ncbi:RNA polymerase sigma-70 factor (ECF subfamily) [Lentzea atacamensis]|uniref:RNA polymerase sigma-70 factor (ECF subfamily) n=1 Tax=Lentzea atacamensis TaxID=531938 RepID=A0A316I7L4_9PSEU|nr:RNA polymerase sigma-70 factor (ECF subfamily) [Lentzea atacamensis]
MSKPPAKPARRGEPPPEISDEDLLSESLATPERLATIFDRYAPVVHGYLSRRVGVLADDLVSETFLLAFRGRTGYARDEERRYRAFGRAAGHLEATTEQGEVAGRVDAQALRSELAEALAALPDEDRDVLLLWTYRKEEYNHDRPHSSLGYRTHGPTLRSVPTNWLSRVWCRMPTSRSRRGCGRRAWSSTMRRGT